ncbi:PH domain-containing protein [Micromonospora sp. KC606]|uniref:PH domain-containing protein n=1 Tax=Micromonospora sp. KC606 TaxID=2530379 RepID=UPI00104744D6|nr:PH domain-containing protein [Micromonospora sp. KC606]TDC76101.1 PH domain-containing protein [Micromonospora sp. KC606]
MSRASIIRFRYHQAILVAAIVAVVGALPLATAAWYLLPVLLVPLAVAFWGWRAGTDADAGELRLRALAGERRIRWDQIVELAADPRGRAVARLDDGQQVVLPAVRRTDLPRLVAVTGQHLPDAR